MNNKLRIAFSGFRHGHIFDLLAGIRERESLQIVACCEEDAETRDRLSLQPDVSITHSSFEAMLAEVPCDIVAVGDCYVNRGSLLIRALRAGKHVIADKPICTSLEELNKIESLACEKGLQVGCQLSLRDAGPMRSLREIVRGGAIGEIVTIHFSAQHPLLVDFRPSWFFERGKHGGTINDIGVHAFDAVAWITGHRASEIIGARNWNAKATRYPHFCDAAQVMVRLENQGGMLADFSYLAPEKCGYTQPFYWQIVCHGTCGLASTRLNASEVSVITDFDEGTTAFPVMQGASRQYLDDFLAAVSGRVEKEALNTSDVLVATREALMAQSIANGNFDP